MNMISQYEFGNKDIWNRELLKESFQYVEPIELPSDEEIEKNGYQDKGFDDIWKEGAKWVIEHIKQQVIP